MSPFGIAFTTWLVTRWRTGSADFDELANFVSISAVIYGGSAVAVDLLIMGGAKSVFYGIATIIKLLDGCQNQDLLDFRIGKIELATARMATILKIL